jgi:hypothetical protein
VGENLRVAGHPTGMIELKPLRRDATLDATLAGGAAWDHSI